MIHIALQPVEFPQRKEYHVTGEINGKVFFRKIYCDYRVAESVKEAIEVACNDLMRIVEKKKQ